jgi:1,4-dihydroxy-2-naphthoyl-CoA hydrolase
VDVMGLVIDAAGPDEVTAHLDVDPARHTQGLGIVHGGVFSGIVETLASIGTAMQVVPQGKTCSGMENHTSFVRAVRGGTVTARGFPLHRGRTTELWEVQIHDEQERLVARGTVRMAILEPRGG